MEKIIIAAVAQNGTVGKDGDIPWHIPEDLEHFREETMGSPVVMGKNTFYSLPEDFRPLEGRTNIVLTRSGLENESARVANSLDEAWNIAEETGNEKVFIIGGASVYEQTIEKADRMILTEIHEEYDGDTFFPDWNRENWNEVSRDERGEFSFVEYRLI